MNKKERDYQNKNVWPACKLCANVVTIKYHSGLDRSGNRIVKKKYKCKFDNEKVSPNGHCTGYELK